MKTTIRVWQQARAISRTDSTFSPHTPLWGNPQLQRFYSLPDPQLWASKGITTLKHIFTDGRLSSFLVLREKHAIVVSMTFPYYQLSHATQAQFPGTIVLEPDSVERLLISRVLEKPFSFLYLYLSSAHATSLTKLYDKWKTDIPGLTIEDRGKLYYHNDLRQGPFHPTKIPTYSLLHPGQIG